MRNLLSTIKSALRWWQQGWHEERVPVDGDTATRMLYRKQSALPVVSQVSVMSSVKALLASSSTETTAEDEAHRLRLMAVVQEKIAEKALDKGTDAERPLARAHALRVQADLIEQGVPVSRLQVPQRD